MAENAESTRQRDRSPSYPLIPLEVAIERLTTFEAHFKRSGARPEEVGDAWGIKAKAYANRTRAALRYFGLVEYQGTGMERRVVVSDEGRKYLRAQQEEMRREVLRVAALRPAQIAKFWGKWGRDRPEVAACLDELMFKNGFSEAGARDFLKVYDATIFFAGLSESDKIPPVDDSEGEGEGDLNPPPPHTPPGRIALMDGERIVFTEESQPNQYVKLVASGEVDEDLLDAISDYVNRQKKRLKVMITPVHGAMATEYTDDEEGRAAEERDRKLDEEIDGDE